MLMKIKNILKSIACRFCFRKKCCLKQPATKEEPKEAKEVVVTSEKKEVNKKTPKKRQPKKKEVSPEVDSSVSKTS